MKTLISPLLAIVLTLSLGWPAAAFASLLIRNVHVVSPHALPSGKPVNLLIENGRILSIGGDEPAADEVLDGEGRYLIPGLIDTHVHLQGVPGESDALPSAVRAEAQTQIPKSYLYFGFTTVLDLISSESPIDEWNNQPLAPKAYYCVPVPVPGGYPLAWLPEADQMQNPAARYYLYDGRRPELMAALPDSENHRPDALVKKIAASGARCIKVFYETGFGRLKNLPVPTLAMMQELVAAAQKVGLPVFLHGNSKASYEFAATAGVDLLAHGLWHDHSGASADELQALAGSIKAAGVAVQPTVQVIAGERELFNSNFWREPGVADAMPAALIEWYQSDAGQWMLWEIGGQLVSDKTAGLPEYHVVHEAYRSALTRVRDFTGQLMALSVPLVFGSDTPSGPIYTQFPGVNGRAEIKQWQALGVDPAQLLRALTLDNARLMGLDAELGSVESGKIADLLLLDENPLHSVNAYDTIHTVIVRGRPIARQTLSARSLPDISPAE